MPMDYDDNDFHSQNLHLAGEGISTVSPVLRSYPLPKIEFDDNLHGHLRFDSLVENEVFLGITSQEDNHWIEEYSRGSSGIEFTSSAAESRRNNVWSEATSSESVEMLLKSVGQEERVAGEAIDEPGSLATIMDPNLKQDGVVPNELPENFSGFNPRPSQSHEAQISPGELDSVVLDNNCNLSVPKEKVDVICDDENQEEVEKLTNDLSNNEVDDLPKNAPSNEAEYNITSKETDVDDPKILVCRESNVRSPSNVQSHSIEETENAIAGDHQLGFIKVSAGNDPSEMGEGNVLNENVLASSNTHSGDLTAKDQSQSAKISGSVQVNDENRSSEQDAICMDQDVTFNEIGDTNLSPVCSDMDIEVIGELDIQKNVESSSSAEGCKEIIAPAQGSEADMTTLAEPVTAVESDTIYTLDGVHSLSESVATDDGATKSPILGVSSMHHDNEKRTEVGCLNEGSSKSAASQVASMADCSSEGPLSVADKGASPDHSGKVVHENIDAIMSEQAAEVNPAGLGCSTALETRPLPCDSSAKVDDNVENEGLQAPKELTTGHHAPQSLAVNILDEQPASIDSIHPSECDADHKKPEGDSSVPDELQFVSPSETSSIELSQIAKDTHEAAPEKAPLPEGIEIVEGKGQLVSSNNSMKGDKNFTFEVNRSVGLGQIDKGLQSIPAVQPCNMNMEGSSITSSSSLLNPEKSHDVFTPSPQTPSSATMQVGTKNPERKTRRKSAGKESAKKGTRQKEIAPRQTGRIEKSTPSATGHIIQFEELKPKENMDSGIMKSCSVLPVLTSNLPDLNNSSLIFQQPFTDNQQVQLRAQILVYGSLISGTTPEEPHMIAAFTQSDGGRKAWEATWRSCLERVHSQKSLANNPDTPMQPRSDLKDISHRTPDTGIKQSPVTSVPSKVSSPIGGSTNKATPSQVVSSLIPLSSPLWNMSTPSSVGFPSGGIPRTFLHDFRQSLSPLHPYQTQAAQNFAGHNLPWLSPGPFGGSWVASSPVSSFSVGPRFSAEAVKLTPVKVSGGLGIKHTSSIPMVHSSGPTVFSGQSGQASSEPKSRKRKKVNTSIAVSQIQASVPSQALVAPAAPAPGVLVPQLPLVPGTMVHGQIPVLTQKPTDSITAPVVSSLLASSTHDHPRYTDQVENIVISETLSKIEDSKVQTPVKMVQPSSDSKNTQRKKVTTSPAINRTPVVAYLPPVSLIAQNQTDSLTAPVVTSLFHTPAVFSTSTHDYLRTGYQNMEKALLAEETLSKVEESKRQAENAATIAANEVGHCEGVWSRLERQKGSGVVDDEARIMSSAAAVAKMAAAASVAKMAAAAAKIASNVAEQARLMADEVLLSNRTESFDRSGMISHPSSIISAAREAARRRIEAASAASKHAENLDAIVKAAELAAEAVSQTGKIVGLGDPVALKKLVEAGAPGYWKTSDQLGEVSGHLYSNSGEKNLEDAPNVSVKEIQTSNYGLSSQGHSGNLAENQMMVIDGISGSITGHEKDKRTPGAHKGPNSSETVGVVPETDIGSHPNYVVGQNVPQSASGAWEEHNIKEGCLVEVYKDDGKYKGAWFAANVLSFKDERALVCYTEIQSDEGSEKLKEWVSLEAEGMKVPRIRIAHPMTTMRFEGSRKRRRTAVTDYAWSNGDRVDVWMQDCWREGVVTEPNTIDITSLTVQFPVQGETSIVRSWHVRPTLIWKDGKWIEWSSLKRRHFTESDTPKEKRMKLGSPATKDKPKDKPATNIDIRLELPLSAEESSFNVGKISKDNKKINTLRTVRTGLQKDGPRVIFGVPKPGKKQKFMEVSKHYDGNDKNNTTNDSIKFTRYLKPQPPGPRGWKISSRNEEKQVAETKPRVKSRKPPVPSFRTLVQKDNNNSLLSKSTTREAEMTDKSDRDSVSDVENVSGHQNQMEFGSSSNTEVASKKTFGCTSNMKSESLNKGKQALAKVEAKDKSIPVVTEPRRSNRRIQPTSRLLEGLQSSLTISKIPSVSHGSQRSHNKVTSKGNNNHG